MQDFFRETTEFDLGLLVPKPVGKDLDRSVIIGIAEEVGKRFRCKVNVKTNTLSGKIHVFFDETNLPMNSDMCVTWKEVAKDRQSGYRIQLRNMGRHLSFHLYYEV